MLIRTQRLQMRNMTVHDAPFILRIVNTITWHAYIGDRGVHNLQDAREYLKNGTLKSYEQYGYGLYQVELKDGTPIGVCGLTKRKELTSPDVNFSLLPEHMGKGYMSEAVKALVNYSRNTLKLRRLSALTAPHNERSINLLKKLNFSNPKSMMIGEEELVYLELNLQSV